MQDIHEESLNESVKSEQSPRVVLWEIDLTVQGGERYFFCNELNEKGEPVTWQGRNAAEFVNVTPADQPPGQCAFYLQPPVSLAQPGQPTGMTVDQCHNLPLHLCPQPVFRCDTKIRLRLCGNIHTRDIPLPLRRAYHEAARLRRRTPPGMRQNR